MAPLPPSSDGDWQCFVQWERYRAPLIQLSSPAPTAIQKLADEWAQIPNKKTIADAVHKVQRALEDEQKARVRLQVRRTALEAEDEAVSRLIELSRNRVKEGLQSLVESKEILARNLRALQKVQGAVVSERSRKYTAELLEKTNAGIEEVQADLSAFQRRPSRDSHDRDTTRGSKRRSDNDTSDGDDDDDAGGFGNKKTRSDPKAPKPGSTRKSGTAGKQGQEDADNNEQPDIFGAGQTHAADAPETSPKPQIQPPRSSRKYQYRPNSSRSDRRPDFYQYAPSSSGSQEAAVDIPVVANANEEGLEPRESSVIQGDGGQKMDDEVADNEEPNGADSQGDVPDWEEHVDYLLRDGNASPACVVYYETLYNSGLIQADLEQATNIFWQLIDQHGSEGENWGLAPLIYDYGLSGHPATTQTTDPWIESETELDKAFTSGWQKALADFEKKAPGSNLMALMRDHQKEADEHYKRYKERIFAPVMRKSDTVANFSLRMRVKIDDEKKEAVIQSWKRAIKAARDDEANEELAENLENEYSKVLKRWDDGESVWRPDEDPHQSDNAISFDVGADRIGFDGERSGLRGNWVFARELGGGGHGQATLWESFDQHNGLRSQLVIKQVYAPDQWDDERNSIWYGDSSDNRPKEFAFNRVLSLLHGSDNIVNVYSYATYEALKMYRIYMEFCPHGDLHGLMKLYRETGRSMGYGGNSQMGGLIPVRVIWSIFEGLVSAVCLMHFGYLPPSNENKTFQPLMHRDIKPSNVFLSTPDPTTWQGIPVVKLGDFGITIEDSDRPSSKEPNMGTHGWKAPEVRKSDNRLEIDDDIGLPSDIWAVGRVMLALMNMETEEQIKKGAYGENDEPAFFHGVGDTYGESLCEIVRMCLEKETAKRPSAMKLWKTIHGIVAALYGLRGTPAGILKLQPGPPGELLQYPNYAAGLTVRDGQNAVRSQLRRSHIKPHTRRATKFEVTI